MNEEIVVDGIRVRWEAEARVVSFAYDDDRALTAEAADRIIPVVAGWVGPSAPYGILVDASDTIESGEEWRKRWAAFHQTHADRVKIAVFRAGTFIRGFLLMYSYWSGVELRCLPSEPEARAWLAAGVGSAASGTGPGEARRGTDA